MLVMPCLNSTLAQAAIMKNITMLERNMPDQTSMRIFFISAGSEPIRALMVVSPAAISSSISCDVCQKNRYGVMVVPKMAQMRISCVLLKVTCGMMECCRTVCQSGRASIAEMM